MTVEFDLIDWRTLASSGLLRSPFISKDYFEMNDFDRLNKKTKTPFPLREIVRKIFAAVILLLIMGIV